MRRRLLWSLITSAMINAAVWVWSGHVWHLRNEEPQVRETVAVSVSPIRVERRRPATKPPASKHKAPSKPKIIVALRTPTPVIVPKVRYRPKRTTAAQQDTPMLAPPPPATLALPQGWSRQDFAFLGTTNAAEWLDWKNQSKKWVPRVFVWRVPAEEGYMSRPSLHDTIAQVLSTLHDERAKIYASRSQAVCDGHREGWFLSYVKTEDDPPLHLEETIFMDGTTIYRATYVRAAEQQEDPKARAALNTLCV